ncbi:MAG TPA: cyclodeaminase/cyclohydrolase family protein [Gaiellaceae bacterium]|nr:cyclodeaminase/cyclohydrolase family protein [Gaiellaceae bacterium]
MADDYLDLRLEDFLDLSASEPAPGAGSAAAVTIALAASLVTKVARASRDSWAEAAGVAAQAQELQHRCPTLAREDADAWQQALQALGSGMDAGDGELARRLDRAADLPLAIAETGADVAGLALLAAECGEGSLRGEAVSAAVLAEAGVRAAAHLVVINLKAGTDDDRCARAGRAERAAASAVAGAFEAER